MQLCIVFFGKPRPAPLATGIDLYLGRIQKLIDCRTVSLRPERIDRRSPEEIKEVEAQRLFGILQPTDWLAVCDERGETIDTASLAERLQEGLTGGARFAGKRRIVVAVGPALGFAKSVRQRADNVWSLSGLTLAESVARLMLTEGIYRALTIVRGHPYHND
jgi:23S rRNA (pseudouridine1915-N3)-methyltransferase